MAAESLSWPNLAKSVLQDVIPYTPGKRQHFGDRETGLSRKARKMISNSFVLHWDVGVIANMRTEVRHLKV